MCIRACSKCGGPVTATSDVDLCPDCRFTNLEDYPIRRIITDSEILNVLLARLELSEEGTIQTIDDQGWFFGLEPHIDERIRERLKELGNVKQEAVSNE